MESYNPKEIERKWQEVWLKQASAKIDKDDTRKKFYILDMFPYPSGTGLHMGHTESYTASDVFYRFKKMQGFNVLHPQGFDAFGLPAENYAIKTGVPPVETTRKNMENYIRQMRSLGFNYDFSEQAITSDPEYYKWTQWIFSEFYKNGLVYKKTQKTNWCSSCQTVIANEQVVENECERCGTGIEQKEMPTWFFKITDFAEELIADLDNVDWPEYTKKNQRAWIGKSEGTEFDFAIKDLPAGRQGSAEKIRVFTTRVDTVYGVTYVVVAPEHPVITQLESQIANRDEVFAYIEKSKNKTELDRMEAKEKTGVELDGIKAVNPFNGEEVPVFVADYVLGNYGTGAVMAVPAHDERDWDFAKKYDLSIKQSIAPIFVVKEGKDAIRDDAETVKRKTVVAIIKHWEEDKIFCLNWEKFGWKSFIIGGVEDNESGEEAAIREVKEESGFQNIKTIRKIGGEVHSNFYASHKGENRYAKTECYYIELGDGGFIEPKEEETKNHRGEWVKLKDISKYVNLNVHEWFCKIFENGDGAFVEDGVLVNSENYLEMSSEEAREKMTAWLEEKDLGKKVVNYRLRDWSISRQRYWGCPIPIVYSPEGEPHLVPVEHLPWMLPEDVDFVPTGVSPLAKSKELQERTEKIFGAGFTAEYDTMDTFVDSSWYFLRYPDVHNAQEFCSEKRKAWLPVDVYIGGAEHTYMHLLYARFFVKALHKIGHLSFKEPFLKLRHQGMVLDKEGKKMSKSKGNVINPDDMVEKFGADSVRMYMMFVAPLEDAVMWNEENIVGVRRFLERVWRLQEKIVAENTAVESLTHKAIKKVGEDIEAMKFNTAISAMMILVNEADKSGIAESSYELLVTILAPFAPHMAEEIWNNLGHTESIFVSSWPAYDPELIKDEKINLVVQVNGKVRDTIEVEADIAEDEAKKVALESEKVKAYVVGKEIRKIIYVKNKLISIVV
ncbi:MAG: Leucyl-tRNA synthetase [Candidatus Moranbacteria bacterium GW2011_GWA2_39_41]|nr:MAG: Leucyl-tRNA synthetase [Candidatus Moranbacteria bacterium GW2011_GWA2_39_41]